MYKCLYLYTQKSHEWENLLIKNNRNLVLHIRSGFNAIIALLNLDNSFHSYSLVFVCQCGILKWLNLHLYHRDEDESNSESGK